ncbi:unnamed protein product [Symbiodinium natans]|uniref:Uncharacterized protein n=1 Tax=Symbiodinium natans TaxID=878477 RepID=A0A812UCD1_9DINO|nr:unnamed protein product [Symbiodinium natans]
MADDTAAEVTFEVSLLSGTAASIACPGDASLGSLQREIGMKLGLLKGDEMPSLFFLPSRGEGGQEPLQETITARELANQSIIAGVNAEPGWCSNKSFKKFWVHGRRGGMEEDSADVVVKLHAGGIFSYWAQYHSHDAECGFNYDQTIEASGTWRLNRRASKDKGELEEVICLEGTATKKTAEQHRPTRYSYYDYDDDYASSSGSEHTDDSEGEEEPPTPKKKDEDKETLPMPKNKDETVTVEFLHSIAKADLLTPDTGMHKRGGWTVTDLPPEPKPGTDAGATTSG